jgi:thiamine biosynthesis lipoprotein
MATSSTTVRRWTQEGIQRHHLVDPATGKPAVSPWRTATVAAPSCVDANTVATAAIVKADRAPDWVAGIGLPTRLVATDGRVLLFNGWPKPAAVAA